jgi:3-deoxy-D-manno-octulosonic-acid transferase
MPAVSLTRTAYSLLGSAITPALHVWLNRRSKRGKEDAKRLPERFGKTETPRPLGTVVWLHAASVGETQSVLTLVRALLEKHQHIHVLITTGTVTSAALVAQQKLPRTIHQYVPVDTYFAVKRFLTHWHPDLALWVESEFWPQLLWQAKAQHIPMLLINARISQKTYEGWLKWPRTIRDLLHAFCSIYAGSTDDAARLADLGGSDISDVGNLKYDAAPLPVSETLLNQLSGMCAGRPVLLAASTHANEELVIAAEHAIIAQHFPKLLTIIVPRHAARGNAIAADFRARGVKFAQRSKSEPITADTAIYLADTMGELGSFYKLANVVFMGGSLIAHGGQNPLEAARFNNALITGPHTHNFTAIIARFKAADAIHIVSDKNALAHEVTQLLKNDIVRDAMAKRATTVVEQARGASAIILQQCDELIARSKS